MTRDIAKRMRTYVSGQAATAFRDRPIRYRALHDTLAILAWVLCMTDAFLAFGFGVAVGQ